VTTSIEIKKPWARLGIDKADTAGGFFTVINGGEDIDRLVSAATPAAASVEIHAIKVVGGDIRMRQLENGLAFYPATTIELKPRGYHLLMTGLKVPMAKGAKVPATLTFERAGDIAIEMTVEAPGPVGYEALDKAFNKDA
jgi:periplasmic copper chaperone A